MITVGIDLATEDARTAACVVRWDRGATVEDLRVEVDDAAAVQLAVESDKCAIDAPFGWPRPFVEFVQAHQAGQALPPTDPRGLQLRMTDLCVQQTIGIRPLSVSANLIGATAMRCARLLEAIGARRGGAVDRSGSGLVVEGYPAAALKLWELRHSRYKGSGDREMLRRLVADLLERVPLRMNTGFRALLASSHDAFDALVCALLARAAALGNTLQPEDAALARVEGWIHLPDPALGVRGCLGLDADA